MKRFTFVLVGVAGLALGAGTVACNGLLGINSASLEAEDSGTPPVSDGGGGDGAPVLACDSYCALMEKNCAWASAYNEYITPAACLEMCNDFDQGQQIASDGTDTLGCRLSYAIKAGQDPALNCRFAGLTGGGKCGSNLCTHFCGVDLTRCNTAPINTPAYDGGAQCLSECAGYTYLTGDGGPGDGELNGMESGNTLNCRIWHLNNAFGLTSHGMTHCPHTAQVSSVCF